jgi:hypothetical protein
MLETFLNPLLNLNVISNEPSVLDRRANIYYPVRTKTNNKNLFDFATSNNNPQYFRISVENPSIYPNEIYIMNEIYRVLKYSSDRRDRLIDHDGNERCIHEIVYRYYANFGECFSIHNKTIPYHNSIKYDLIVTDHVSREYCYNHEINEQLYTTGISDAKNAIVKLEQSIKLFDSSQPNNILFQLQNNPQPESDGENTPTQTTVQSNDVIGVNDPSPNEAVKTIM